MFPTHYPSRSIFMRWENALPPFIYDPSTPFASILVPTVDTARYGNLLRTCLEAARPVLIIGDSGAGKSAIVMQQLAALSCGGTAGNGAADDGGVQGGVGAAAVEGGGGGGEVVPAVVTCSALTGSAMVQGHLQSKLTKRNGR